MGMQCRKGLADSRRVWVLLFCLLPCRILHASEQEAQSVDNIIEPLLKVLPSGVFIEEMVVTAQKREQSPQDVPIALSAFSMQALDDLGVENLQQLSNFVPGVRVQEQSVTYTGISIRGVTSDNSAPSQAPRVSVFQNGVDISRARGSNIALYDLERVEVLRGPQGTLFGRGAEVGALSIFQQGAQNTLSGSLKVAAGSYNEQLIEGHINAPVVDDEVALRLAFYQHYRDGTVDNLAGGSLAGIDTRAARAAINWQASDAMRWQGWLNYQQDNPSGTPFISFYFPESDSYRQANIDIGLKASTDRTLWDATLRGDYDFNSRLSLTSISAYRSFDTKEIFDADGFSLPILAYENSAEHQQFSQELRWNFSDGDRWQGFAGLNYQWEQGEQALQGKFHEGYLVMLPKVMALMMAPDQPFDQEVLRQPPPLFELYAPLQQVGGIPLNPTMSEWQYDRVENHSADMFIDASYDLNDRWQLSAGVRLSYEDLTSGIETPSPSSPASLSLLPQTCADGFLFQAACNEFGQVTARQLEQSDQFWGASGRLLSRYRVSDDWAVYSSYARGRRPNVLSYTIQSEPDNLRPEVVDSFELGSKWQSLDSRYSLDLSAFYFRYQNFVTAVNTATPIAQLDDNGEAVSKGIEIEARGALTDSWTAFANTAYNDARITHADDVSFIGNRFRLAPLWSGAVGLSQQHSLSTLGYGTVTLTYSFQSTVYFEDDNSSNFDQNRQESYGLANLRYQLNSATNDWQIELWVNNLLDQEYIIDAGNTGALFGLNTYVPGSPRLLGASLAYQL